MNDNSLPYRLPFNLSPASQASSPDEQNIDTLRQNYRQMGDEMERLLTINGIDLTRADMKVKEQIAANQIAYDILLPMYQALETAINEIDNKWRQG